MQLICYVMPLSETEKDAISSLDILYPVHHRKLVAHVTTHHILILFPHYYLHLKQRRKDASPSLHFLKIVLTNLTDLLP